MDKQTVVSVLEYIHIYIYPHNIDGTKKHADWRKSFPKRLHTAWLCLYKVLKYAKLNLSF